MTTKIKDVMRYIDRTAAEIASGVTPTLYQFGAGVPERYGAVGDGVTDDTAALTNCIAANYLTVLTPGKTYLTTGVVITASSRMIVGGGPNCAIKCSGAPGSFGIKFVHASGIGTHFQSGAILENFNVSCAATANQIYGIWMANAELRRMTGVLIDMSANTYAGVVRNATYGFRGSYQQDGVFVGCTFTGGSGANSDGCYLQSLSASELPNDNTFLGCRFQSCGGWGMRQQRGVGNVLIGGKFQANTSGGFLEGDDGAGNGGVSTTLYKVGFEVNTGDDLKVDVGLQISVRDCSFQSTGVTNSINALYLSGGVFDNNYGYNGKPAVFAAGTSIHWRDTNSGFAVNGAAGVLWETRVYAITYSATMATDASLGDHFSIGVTNASAMTISNPTNARDGMRLTYEIYNTSGGAMGAITWGANFRLAGAFTNPANNKRRTITFYPSTIAGTTYFIEESRAAADI